MYKLYLKENVTSQKLLDEALNDNGIYTYELTYNELGKPYLKGEKIFFNISNKDNITVCAISNREIGIDIEKKIYNLKVAKKVFNSKELSLLNQALDKEREFSRIWTMKESYSKLKGIGLSYGLENIDTTSLANIDIKEYNNYIIAIAKSSEE